MGRLFLAGAMVLTLAGCSGGDDATGDPSLTSPPGSPAEAACPVATGDEAAKSILACAERSLAFVETLYGTGTGFVVEAAGATYLMTNLHVVEPFSSAAVTIDGRDLGRLPLVGADVAADIAVFGPLQTELPPLRLGDGRTLERGDAVYLIGYPGESPGDEHVATISSGIVSRHREAEAWDQVYVQSDSTISGGQSGGPLFDGQGRLVGVSGLSFDDFALSLSASDAQRALDRILQDGGDELVLVPAALPGEGGASTGTVSLDHAGDVQSLFLPPADETRLLNLQVSGADDATSVTVIDSATGEELAVSASTERLVGELRRLLDERGSHAALDVDPAMVRAALTPDVRGRELQPGSFAIEVVPGQALDVLISVPLADGPRQVAWRSDHELWASTAPVTTRPLTLGEHADGILNAFDTSADFTIDLAAGQTTDLWVGSPQGDVAVLIVPPSVTLDAVSSVDPTARHLSEFDDSNEGLFGLDVHEQFTADEAGTYRFKVYSMEPVPTAFRISVSDPPAA